MALIKTFTQPLGQEIKVVEDHQSTSHQVEDLLQVLIEKEADLLFQLQKGYVGDKELERVIYQSIASSGQKSPGLVKAVKKALFGYGPLQTYVEDQTISDIEASSFEHFSIVRQGKREVIPVKFSSEDSFLQFLQVMVTRLGGSLNITKAHCRITDHRYRLRINAIIPPRAPQGSFLVIRKHQEEVPSLADLIAAGMLTKDQGDLLVRAIDEGKNLLLTGKGGAGKTTLLRALLMEASEERRYLVCEAEEELFLKRHNIMSTQTHQGERHEQVTLNQLLQDGLTLRIDAYVVGELTGPEVYDFLNAGLSNHQILGTIHASGKEAVQDRIYLMLKKAYQTISQEEAHEIIKESIQLMVHLDSYQVQEIYSRGGEI